MLQAIQVILAATVAAGYFTVAAFVVPRLQLHGTRGFARAVRVGATFFFVGCGLTHMHILVHAATKPAAISLHEIAFHVMQVGGVWVFALAALRVVDIRVERRKTAEERLQEQIDSLARSNADLEEFARVVSHDLREPLATINGFAGLLERRHGGDLRSDAGEMVRFIRESSDRMSRMLTGVLDYSRAAGTGLRRERVDLSEVLAEVTAALTGRIREADAVVTADPLPVLWGDRLQLARVLQNLLANAVKFRRTDRPPHVHVWAEEDDAGWTISVRDDGIGVDPDHAERIFRMFERAHPDGEGTGIGLAVCQKIVSRHGGRLWVEPTEGGGSVFRFSLPQRLVSAVPAEPSLV
jgi:signal transduction histidine kinase